MTKLGVHTGTSSSCNNSEGSDNVGSAVQGVQRIEETHERRSIDAAAAGAGRRTPCGQRETVGDGYPCSRDPAGGEHALGV